MAYSFGIVSLHTRETAIAAFAVLGLLFLAWMTALYAVPLFLADFSDHPSYGGR